MATTGAPHELDDELRDDRLEGALHTWRDYDRRRRAFSSSDLFMLFTLFMQSNESGPPNLEAAPGTARDRDFGTNRTDRIAWLSRTRVGATCAMGGAGLEPAATCV
jgi:hypothetical protein